MDYRGVLVAIMEPHLPGLVFFSVISTLTDATLNEEADPSISPCRGSKLSFLSPFSYST